MTKDLNKSNLSCGYGLSSAQGQDSPVDMVWVTGI